MVKQPPTDELLFQVATQQNENDKPFIIECEAEGDPAPKWVTQLSWIPVSFVKYSIDAIKFNESIDYYILCKTHNQYYIT